MMTPDRVSHRDGFRHARGEFGRESVRHFNFSESGSNLYRPFGGMPNAYSGALFNQIRPILHGFSLGGGSPAFQNRLATAQGPLASFIRNVQGFAPNVGPQAQQLGQYISQQGQQGYDQLRQQISGALGALPGFQQASASALPAFQQGLGYAQQAASDAFSPVRSRALFQQTAQNVLEPLRQAAAARGLEAQGAGQASEEATLRNLGLNFAQNDLQNQQAAISGLGGAANALQGGAANAAQLSAAGIPIAGQQLSALPQLQQALAAQFQIPMEAAGSLLNLLLAGQAPGLQNLQAISQFPVGQSSFGLGVLSCLPDDEPIMTPKGVQLVRDLSIGDPVYSLDGEGRVIEAAVLGYSTKPTPIGHEYVHVVLSNGGIFRGSPNHPLADTRSFGSLTRGDTVWVYTWGTTHPVHVVSATLEPARAKTTRDILIDSPTGVYFLGIAAVASGSTLDLAHFPRPHRDAMGMH